MRFKLLHLLPSAMLLALSFATQGQGMPVFRDPSKPLTARVNNLIAQLSLEEKAQQMLDQSPAIPRLGIPAYSWWNEALHGVGRSAPATVFPQAIGLGVGGSVTVRVGGSLPSARSQSHLLSSDYQVIMSMVELMPYNS